MRTRAKTTIYAVAERAGVSTSTVSRVLNDSHLVATHTRARVLEAIDALDFRPDRTARSLARGQKRTLAIAMPTFTSPYHNELLKGVRLRLRDADVDVLLCDLGWDRVRGALMKFLNRGSVDGLLLVGVEVDRVVAGELKALHAPVVQVGWPWSDFDSFYWDNAAGARLAVDHLLDRGHRRIGMITSAVASTLQGERLRGYRDAVLAAGLPYDPALVRSGATTKHAGFSEESGYEAMTQLLALDPPVTAVFASSDVQAVGAWKAIRDAGKRVPGDIALVGYDDVKTSAYIGLSTVDQDLHGVGYRAADLWVKRVLEGDTGARHSVLIPPRLHVRESSK